MMFRAPYSAMALRKNNKKKLKSGHVGKQHFENNQVSSWHRSSFLIKIKLEYLGMLGFFPFYFVLNKSV